MSTSFNPLEAAAAKLDMNAIAASAAATAANGIHYNSNSTSTSNSSLTSSPLTPPNNPFKSSNIDHNQYYNNLIQDYGNFTSEMSISDMLGLNLPRGTSLGTTNYSSLMSISPSEFGTAAPQRPCHLNRFNNNNNHNYTSCNNNSTNGINNKIQQPQSHSSTQQAQRQTCPKQPPATPQNQHLNSYCQGAPTHAANENLNYMNKSKTQPMSSQQPSVHSPMFPREQIQSNRYSEVPPSMKLPQRNWDSILHSVPYYPRAYKSASPSYSDSGSPTGLETGFMLGSGSRSHSPADSETSASSFGEYVQNNYPMGQIPSTRTRVANQLSHPQNVSPNLLDLSSPDIASNFTPSPFHPLTALRYPLPQANLLNSLLQYQTFQSPLIDKPLYFNNSLGYNDTNPLEKAAKFYRNSASLCDPHTKWEGSLPPKTNTKGPYSCKVFLGGVPWDIHEAALINAFKQFGEIQVQWPGKDQGVSQTKGFCYIILESEKQLKAMLASCNHDANGTNYFYKISSRKMKSKIVEVIPWHLSDSNYVSASSQKLDPLNTVFVGALHGMLTAEGLAHIMNKLFEGVVYAGIDTDKHKYPIGSGRVTFDNNRSYMRAVAAAFIEIKTLKFTKKVQVDPYLEDSLCSECNLQQGPYFCREMVCFRYFCRTCWHNQHSRESFATHKPLMRNCKSHGLIGFNRRPSNN